MDAANSQIQSIQREVDDLFEPSPALHILLSAHEEQLLAESEEGHVTFDMITYIGTLLYALQGRPELDEILNSHPRLGAKKVKSLHSQAEQRNLGAPDSTESQRLEELNARYESTFPGLRYVVFVNGRPRDVIMENMEARIQRADITLERRESIDAMLAIARDRLSKKM